VLRGRRGQRGRRGGVGGAVFGRRGVGVGVGVEGADLHRELGGRHRIGAQAVQAEGTFV